MRLFTTLAAAAALTAPMALTATPAEAHRGNHGHKYAEWQGKDGRTYCRKSNGTVGLIVGGAGGALLGRAVDTRGERATGTIIGAAAGALIGREISSKRRCR